MIDEDKLHAWIDGELPPEEAARVERAVAADPELARKAEAQRALKQKLRAAFGPLLDAPVPPALIAAVRQKPSAEVVNLAAVRAARAKDKKHKPAFEGQRWGALAAALIAGLVGGYVLKPTGNGPAIERGGALIASAPIARALDTQLASAGGIAGPVQARLTFRDTDGRLCRSFTGTTGGVACRAGSAWVVRALFAGEGAKAGAYRTAGSDAQLATFVDGIIAGDPFDAAAETRARANHWQLR